MAHHHSQSLTFGQRGQCMAQSLREEMTARGKPREKEAEDAMTVVVSAIRQLEAAGELVLEKDED